MTHEDANEHMAPEDSLWVERRRQIASHLFVAITTIGMLAYMVYNYSPLPS